MKSSNHFKSFKQSKRLVKVVYCKKDQAPRPEMEFWNSSENVARIFIVCLLL